VRGLAPADAVEVDLGAGSAGAGGAHLCPSAWLQKMSYGSPQKLSLALPGRMWFSGTPMSRQICLRALASPRVDVWSK
jgi:hypothetical protein